jgi:hypothetical protein
LFQSFGNQRSFGSGLLKYLGNKRTPGSRLLENLGRTLLFGSFGKYSRRNKIRSPTRAFFYCHFLKYKFDDFFPLITRKIT